MYRILSLALISAAFAWAQPTTPSGGGGGAGVKVVTALPATCKSVGLVVSLTTGGKGIYQSTSVGPPCVWATAPPGPAGTGFSGSGTYAEMIASAPSANNVWELIDSASPGYCGSGGGTSRALCIYTGAAWVPSSGMIAGGSSGQVPYQTNAGITGFTSEFAFNATTGLGVIKGVTVGQNGGTAGLFKINGLTTGTITIKGADAAGTWSLTLPTSGGTNKYFLMTDGSGVSTWSQVDLAGSVTGKLPAANIADTAVTPGSYTSANITVDQQGRITAAANGTGGTGGATPAGGDTAVQFNDGGSTFGADATNFNYNKTTHVLTVTGGISASSAASLAGAEQAAPTVSTPTLYFDSTVHLPQYKNDSNVLVGTMIAPLADPGADHNWVKYIPSTGIPARTRPVCADLLDADSGCSTAAYTLPSPGPSTPGGVKSLTCTGTDKLSAIGTDGLPVCSTDQNSGGGGTGVGRAVLSPTYTAIADGSCQEQTATWTGVGTSDTVIIGMPSNLTAGLTGNARVSASNTVAIRLCNFSGGSLTPGAVNFNGTLAIYNLSGTGTIDFASIPDGSCVSSTFALAGVAAGDPIAPKWPASIDAGLVGNMLASATDTVQVRLCNWSGSAVDPASATFGASIAK